MEEKKISAAPLVSIIIPVYNVAQYLRECLDSAVGQTLREIEIIVVNDASTDGAQPIIDEYAKKDPRIVSIVHEKNKRQGAARNSGLAVRRGKYVMFLDGDDYLDVAACEILYKKMEHTGADFIEFNFEEMAENLDISPGGYSIAKEGQLPDPLAAFLQFHLLGAVCNKIFKTEVWNNICFRENMLYEDEVAIFELLQYCTGAIKIPRKFYFYRRWPGSTTRTTLTEEHACSMVRVLEEIHGIARAHAFYGPYIQGVNALLTRYCFIFLHRVQQSGVDEKTRRRFYSMVAKKFVGLGAEYASAMNNYAFDMEQKAAAVEQRHKMADQKLRQRKKIILALFAYAFAITTACVWALISLQN